MTIQNSSKGLYKDKGSRFIAFAIPIETVDEAKKELDILHKNYHDARHICYAYILGADMSLYRAYDDGEPSGTGGRPIYGVLLSNKLTNVLIAVVRYFGGVKLGTGGLITAYREAAADAIKNGEIIENVVQSYFNLSFEYSSMNTIMNLLKEKKCSIIKQDFGNNCEMQFCVQKDLAETIKSKLQLIENLQLKLLKTK